MYVDDACRTVDKGTWEVFVDGARRCAQKTDHPYLTRTAGMPSLMEPSRCRAFFDSIDSVTCRPVGGRGSGVGWIGRLVGWTSFVIHTHHGTLTGKLVRGSKR